MTNKAIIFIGLTAVLSWGCSGSTETANNANKAAAVANSNISANRVAAPNTQSTQLMPSSNVPGANASGQKRMVDSPPENRPPTQFTEAPEDSTLTTTMNPSGQILEIRVFKSHPQLAKVEATWLSPQEKSVKLFLRNGHNVEVNTDKVTDLKTMTAAQLLQLGGLGGGQPANKARPSAKGQ